MEKEQAVPPHRRGMIVLILALLFLAGGCKAVMDTLQFHYGNSVFAGAQHPQFWNPRLSWTNKYQDGNPAQGAAYPGSTTCLVFLTDGWHLFQFLFLTCYELIIVLLLRQAWHWRWPALLGTFLGMKVFFGLSFELFFAGIFPA